jgi:hypothetical protein
LNESWSDRARRSVRVGKTTLIPAKFDKQGVPVGPQTKDPVKLIKMLDQRELMFLNLYRSTGWNVNETMLKSGLSETECKRILRKVEDLKDEEPRIKALADIPTTPFIMAKHMENLDKGSLNDSQRDSLKELAKIQGSYKNTNQINIQNNVFNLPKVDPETAAKLKAIGDAAVDVEQVA